MARNENSEMDELLKALEHSMRRAILREIDDEDLLSPSEAAPLMEDSVSNVSYHFRTLAGAGLAELVEEKQVRGATQHFYRRTLKRPWVRKLLEEPED